MKQFSYVKFKPTIEMDLKVIHSHRDLLDQLDNSSRSYLLLYKKGTDQSDCALRNLQSLKLDTPDLQVMAADVNEVRDIHTQYGVNSVPTLLAFEAKDFKNLVKGCHEENFYKSYFENIILNSKLPTAINRQKELLYIPRRLVPGAPL